MGWRSSVGESTLTRMSRLPAISAASVACMLGLVWPASAQTSSFYTTRLDDSKAVYLTNDAFAVIGDGAGDDTAAVQAAINKVQETTGEGIVFVPSGRYRVTNTVYVWGGIRLIGYGATRPVFVLGANTPGYRIRIKRSTWCSSPAIVPARDAEGAAVGAVAARRRARRRRPARHCRPRADAARACRATPAPARSTRR